MMRRLFRIELSWAFSRAFTKFGIAIAANNPMMATTIMISTSVKPAFLFVLICMTNLSVVSARGVNQAKGWLLLLLHMFTYCPLQPRCSTLANGMPQSTFAKACEVPLLGEAGVGSSLGRKRANQPRKSAVHGQKEEFESFTEETVGYA